MIHPANPSVIYTGLYGSSDIFVTKLNGTGTALNYSTYIGNGTVNGIGIDSVGNAYISGYSIGGIPLTPDAIQSTSISYEAFLAKVSATGSDLQFATYLGGNGDEFGNGIATDSVGNCYLAGRTSSANFPTTPGAFQTSLPGLNGHGFVAKIALPITANSDSYTTSANNPLSVPVPGVLGNDTSGGQGNLSVLLLSNVSNGTLTLNSDGSFFYSPNANFIGYDSFTYKARASNGVESNIAEVTIQVSGTSSSCTISLSPPSISFPGTGGTGSITINTENGCTWKAYNHAPAFITLTSSSTGTGAGTLTYTVTTNSSTSARTGTIIVEGQTHTIVQDAVSARPFDFDRDGNADVGVFRPSTGAWLINHSNSGASSLFWGTNGDQPVSADYDGDGKSDIAVFRPSNGTWYIRKSSDTGLLLFGWGVATDKVAPADYDGDGKADVTVFRPSNGTWYIQKSSNGLMMVVGWGTSGDVPISGVP